MHKVGYQRFTHYVLATAFIQKMLQSSDYMHFVIIIQENMWNIIWTEVYTIQEKLQILDNFCFYAGYSIDALTVMNYSERDCWTLVRNEVLFQV